MENTTSRRPLRAALYARCSTSDQRPDLQLSALRDLAVQRGWHVAGEFVDIGWSGLSTKRPQLELMKREVGSGHIDVVAAWRFDRLGRSTRDFLNLLEELRVRGVEVVSAQENVDTSSPIGRVFLMVIALMAEMEREWLRDRTKAGLAAARRRGAILGRPRVTVDLVRAHELLREGQSVRQTARAIGVGASTLSRALRLGDGPLPQARAGLLVQPDAA
jgi:Enterobacteriaceae phage serine recombinase